MIVEIWSDVVCPWCYIGKRRFESAVELFSADHPDVEIDVRYRSFMLDPTAPVGESQPVREVYEKKFGGPEAADEILQRVTAEAAEEGLTFDMDIAQRSNTLLAHRLLVLAEHLGMQPQLKERLLAAYFTEGRAIGDLEVLLALGVEAGLAEDDCREWLESGRGMDEVLSHLDFAADNGITSVPTFVLDRKVAVPGAQKSELFLQVLQKQLSSSS